MDVLRDLVHVIVAVLRDAGRIVVADEFPVLIVVARREGLNALTGAGEHLRLRGEDQGAGCIVSVVEGADADGVSGRDEGILRRVVNDTGEFRVQKREHGDAQTVIKRKQDLAVALALETVSDGGKIFLQRAEAVDLSVAYTGIPL